MSWGERSCFCYKGCVIPDECNINTCNVDCRCYHWDGMTKPDSEPYDKRKDEELSKDIIQHLTSKSKWCKKKGNKLFFKK